MHPKIPTLAELQAEAQYRYLRDFVAAGWRTVDPTPFVPNWHVDAICDHLEAVQRREIRQLIINIPPGFAKSLLVSVLWPAWSWLRQPSEKLLSGSYAAELSVRDALKTRDVVTSDWYRGLVMHVHRAHGAKLWQLKDDQNRKDAFKNTAHGERLATSVGGRGTGMRADKIIVDDPLNALEAEYSEAARRTANAWISGTLSTRFSDATTGVAVVVMQRLHQQDCTGALLEEGGWHLLRLPMEFEPVSVVNGVTFDNTQPCKITGFVDPRKQPGELLFPARLPETEVTKGKRQLKHRWHGQYQQNPRAEGGNMLKDAWITRYTAADLPPEFDRIGLSVDANFGDGVKVDPVSLLVWGQKGPNHDLLDRMSGPWDFLKTLAAIQELRRRWPKIGPILVEKKANGAAILATLRQHVPGLIEITPKESKTARLASCLLFFESRNVRVPEASAAPWVAEYVDQLTAFPTAPHDDDVDATSQWLNWSRTAPGTFSIHAADDDAMAIDPYLDALTFED